jgi:hypothetical protein
MAAILEWAAFFSCCFVVVGGAFVLTIAGARHHSLMLSACGQSLGLFGMRPRRHQWIMLISIHTSPTRR